jgi:NAD(P)-dependent dehydrogenase (short-subunit alcohol dehydrogenase family)
LQAGCRWLRAPRAGSVWPLPGALAAAGSEIVLNGFGKPEEVADVQAKIAKDFKVRVTFSPTDMSKPVAIREMVEKILQTSGRLDILVNNAGIQHVAPLQDFPPEKWDAILAIDLSSAFHTTRLALPSMLANKWGRVINGFATVEEIGALSVFLASDAAASITGIALPVDGGWTAH